MPAGLSDLMSNPEGVWRSIFLLFVPSCSKEVHPVLNPCISLFYWDSFLGGSVFLRDMLCVVPIRLV